MDELKGYLELEQNIYRLLAFAWMKELTNDWLADFKKFAPVFSTMAESSENELLLKGCALINELPGSIDEEEYARQFTSIFLGVDFSNRRKSITPHESVYRSVSGLMKQDEWERVYEFFVRESVGKNADFYETEDHISAEMHFLAVLSRQAVKAMDAGDMDAARKKVGAMSEFLSNHISKWVDKLLEHLLVLTKDPLYMAIGYLSVGFIHADKLHINEAAAILAEAN